MARTLGPVALKLGDEVLIKVRNNTTIEDLLVQLDKACKGGRIQDAEGFDVTAPYSQDLLEGEYYIKQPAAGGLIDAAVRWCCGFCPARRATSTAAVCFQSVSAPIGIGVVAMRLPVRFVGY